MLKKDLSWLQWFWLGLQLVAGALFSQGAEAPPASEEARSPGSPAELRGWLESMVWFHGYSILEMSAATGMKETEVTEALARLQIRSDNRPVRATNEILILPYPGGRHPRLGFFDGAIRTQRETKLSVFPPWSDSGYVVVDVPEAIFSNLGLLYLAHTHVKTLWDERGLTLPKLEWSRAADGAWECQRTLPNGIAFGVRAAPLGREAVTFRLWLRNGTPETVTALRSQVCVMLGRAPGFHLATNDNKRLDPPWAAVRHEKGRRWILTTWEPLNRVWANPPVPCLHADPAIPDCPPGQIREAQGWLWFYEGEDLSGELARRRAQWRIP